MSFKKSKLDLLVRVRYSNPLPAPPCPPKLLDIPTNPMRYARPEFLETIANDTPLPMIIDAECGMPLDLAQWESLWTEEGDDSLLNPDPKNLPKLDPKDQFLLGDLSSAAGSYVNGGSNNSGTPASQSKTVTWLRKTEYISRVDVSRSSSSQEPKNLAETVIDISRAAQIRDIEASFAASQEKVDLKALRHPNNPNISVMESYEVFPDADIWANAYDLFRFSERPGERPVEVDDPRLDCAIMRPMESDGDHFLSYYLTKDDEVALQFKQRREDHVITENEELATPFQFVRDYETVKVEQEVPNEFLLVLDDGTSLVEGADGEAQTVYRRPKGAYYKNIERKMLLKKKRVNPQETYDKWDVINVTHVQMSQEEEDERSETLAEVMDPLYLLGRVDIDAEGEVVDDVSAP